MQTVERVRRRPAHIQGVIPRRQKEAVDLPLIFPAPDIFDPHAGGRSDFRKQ